MTSTTPPNIKSPHKPAVKVNAPDSNNLKNFFQNLLNKNAPSNASNSTATNTLSSNTNQNQTSDNQASPPINQKSE
jgi:hypothetical protein